MAVTTGKPNITSFPAKAKDGTPIVGADGRPAVRYRLCVTISNSGPDPIDVTVQLGATFSRPHGEPNGFLEICQREVTVPGTRIVEGAFGTLTIPGEVRVCCNVSYAQLAEIENWGGTPWAHASEP
jgi:hypothetical protein